MSALPVLDQLSYRPAQAAQVVGVSRSRMYELIRSGAIRSIKDGKDHNSPRLIRREALIEWLDGLERAS